MVDEIGIDYNNIEAVSRLLGYGVREAVLLRTTAEPVYMSRIDSKVNLGKKRFKIRPKTTKYFDGKTKEDEEIECNIGDSIFLRETSASGRVLDSEELKKHFRKLSENYRAKRND